MRLILNRWIYFFPLGLWILFFVAACALHMPISEEIIFSQVAQTGDDDSGHSLMHYRGMGTSFSASFYTSEFEEQNFSEYGGTFDTELNANWRYGFAAYAFTFGLGKNVSLGISPGAIVYGSGLDATFRLRNSFFITVTMNLYKNTEMILQKKIGPNLSAGIFYRHEKQEFGLHQTLQRDKLIPANLLGVRGLYGWHKDRIRLRGFTSLGIETGTFTPVLLAGFALTLAPRRTANVFPKIQ